MTDVEIRQRIMEVLSWDRRLDASAIGVEVRDGHVTLRGSTGSHEEQVVASMNALWVFGVRSVHNELRLRSGLYPTVGTDT